MANRGRFRRSAGMSARALSGRAPGVDVVVIGAGAVGLLCAYYLAKGGLRPVVLDRGAPGGEASTHNQQMILAFTKVPGPLAELALRSAELYWQLQVELEDDLGVRQNGTLILFESEAGLDSARATLHVRRDAGLRIELVDAVALGRLEPAVARDLAGAVLSRDAFQIDPVRLVDRLVSALGRRGGEVRAGVAATGIEVAQGRAQAVLTTGGRLPAAAVVLAAGAWSPQLAASVGLDLPVSPRRGLVIETAPERRVTRHMLMDGGYQRRVALSAAQQAQAGPLDRHGVSFVFVQRPDGRCLIGGSREHVGFCAEADPVVLELIRQRQRRFLPGAPAFVETRAYWGFRPCSPDRLPLIGPVTTPAGLYLATGHEGSGLTLGPATGEAIAEMIVRGGSVTDLAPLSPARLGSGSRGQDR